MAFMVLIMFKKNKDNKGTLNILFENIEHSLKNIKAECISIGNSITGIRGSISHLPKIESQQKTIESQQRTIEQLTNALQGKYEHGLFVIGEEGKLPVVIKNGKVLTDENTAHVDVCWNMGSVPCVTIEQ